MSMRKNLCAIALAISTGFAPVAHAGALTGGATEWTQIANNFELMGQLFQQVKMVKQMIDDYYLQYAQLEQLILSGMQIDGISLADVLRLKDQFEGYQSALKELGSDIEGLGDHFKRRLAEAKLLKLPMEEYMKREAQKIESGNKTAKARLARERDMMEQVKADIEKADEFRLRIPTTVGEHQAVQLLNSQTNLLLQQMTRMVELTAEHQGSDQARVLNDEAEARERLKSQNQALIEGDTQIRERDKASLSRMQGYK